MAPAPLPPGDAVLALLGNTVPARERPAESLQAITRALDGAIVMEGERGEAEDVVPLMLAELDSHSVPGLGAEGAKGT